VGGSFITGMIHFQEMKMRRKSLETIAKEYEEQQEFAPKLFHDSVYQKKKGSKNGRDTRMVDKYFNGRYDK